MCGKRGCAGGQISTLICLWYTTISQSHNSACLHVQVKINRKKFVIVLYEKHQDCTLHYIITPSQHMKSYYIILLHISSHKTHNIHFITLPLHCITIHNTRKVASILRASPLLSQYEHIQTLMELLSELCNRQTCQIICCFNHKSCLNVYKSSYSLSTVRLHSP